MILSAAELIKLTGLRRGSSQAAWLRFNGFTFRMAADGHPRVAREEYLRVMVQGNHPQRLATVNLDAVRSYGKKAAKAAGPAPESVRAPRGVSVRSEARSTRAPGARPRSSAAAVGSSRAAGNTAHDDRRPIR